jgi:division protein CdvB (Snf7/Vps24/ESCRT-III family)
MMTQQEFEYIKRAVQAFETVDLSLEDQRKILQTISEITEMAAVRIREKLVDSLVS